MEAVSPLQDSCAASDRASGMLCEIGVWVRRNSAWVRFYEMVGFTADADRGEFARQVVCPLPEWLPPDEERRRRNF